MQKNCPYPAAISKDADGANLPAQNTTTDAVNLMKGHSHCNNPVFQAQNNSYTHTHTYTHLTHMVPELTNLIPHIIKIRSIQSTFHLKVNLT